MVQLSAHFTLEEMIASQEATRQGIDNTPSVDVLEHLKETCARLEEVRALLGRPIIISSGYRSAQLNAAIGGAANSAHMLGYAVDFICPGFGPPLAVCREIEKAGLIYDQLIHEFGAWTHLSFDPQSRREALRIFKDGHGYQIGLAAPATGTRIG
ncbi:MAG TPA: D-Ala-D-Ala carboxypeptidase family metallohydrolase [Micropepsaceae bacterium]|nr:D-Ala-D-Ala carboxypeptidase family metallohydrolase [Micropepsaceae bacterium]